MSIADSIRKHKWTTRAVAVLVVVAIIWLAVKRPQETQAVSASFGFLAAAIIAYLTFRYVHATYDYVQTNQQELAFLREQAERERRVQFAFTVRCNGERAFPWAANLGRVPMMLERVRVSNGEDEIQAEAQDFLPEGREAKVDVTAQLTKAEKYWGDVDVALDYVTSAGSATSDWKGFNLFNDDGKVRRVLPGMHEPETINCPKCGTPALMSTNGLSLIYQKAGRATTAREQMGASCPHHTFDWPFRSRAGQ